MLHVNSAYETQYNKTFTSNPTKDADMGKAETPMPEESKKRAAAYMIGATALASVIMLGVLGHNGKQNRLLKQLLIHKTTQKKFWANYMKKLSQRHKKTVTQEEQAFLSNARII